MAIDLEIQAATRYTNPTYTVRALCDLYNATPSAARRELVKTALENRGLLGAVFTDPTGALSPTMTFDDFFGTFGCLYQNEAIARAEGDDDAAADFKAQADILAARYPEHERQFLAFVSEHARAIEAERARA